MKPSERINQLIDDSKCYADRYENKRVNAIIAYLDEQAEKDRKSDYKCPDCGEINTVNCCKPKECDCKNTPIYQGKCFCCGKPYPSDTQGLKPFDVEQMGSKGRLGAYLNTMVSDLGIMDKGQYLRDLFSKYDDELSTFAVPNEGLNEEKLTYEWFFHIVEKIIDTHIDYFNKENCPMNQAKGIYHETSIKEGFKELNNLLKG